MKHPISHGAARAFAGRYWDAPDDVYWAKFDALCEFQSWRGPEDAPKAETALRLNAATKLIFAEVRLIVEGRVRSEEIAYLDPDRETAS